MSGWRDDGADQACYAGCSTFGFVGGETAMLTRNHDVDRSAERFDMSARVAAGAHDQDCMHGVRAPRAMALQPSAPAMLELAACKLLDGRIGLDRVLSTPPFLPPPGFGNVASPPGPTPDAGQLPLPRLLLARSCAQERGRSCSQSSSPTCRSRSTSADEPRSRSPREVRVGQLDSAAISYSSIVSCPRGPDGLRTSLGSLPHACGEVCLPCKFFSSTRGCHDGVLCGLCHFPHPEITRSGARSRIRRATRIREFGHSLANGVVIAL